MVKVFNPSFHRWTVNMNIKDWHEDANPLCSAVKIFWFKNRPKFCQARPKSPTDFCYDCTMRDFGDDVFEGTAKYYAKYRPRYPKSLLNEIITTLN